MLRLKAALAVACRDIDVRNVKALIIGPHETPYEFGFFEVCKSSGCGHYMYMG
jgi:ubiquitin-conjugating enzyme E2 Z